LAAPADEVRELQEKLNKLGASPRVEEDGSLGPATMVAVKAFQTVASLKADGIAGPITLAAIDQRLNAKR
jgi:putative chitinase